MNNEVIPHPSGKKYAIHSQAINRDALLLKPSGTGLNMISDFRLRTLNKKTKQI